jgi:hypothetical protein
MKAARILLVRLTINSRVSGEISKAAGIQLRQLCSALVGQRKFNRLIEAASQDEQHSASSRSPSISFSNLLSRILRARACGAFPGNKIYILDHHHGWPQETRQPGVLAEQPNLLRCHQQGGVIRQLLSQMVNRVGFTRPRRAIKEKPLRA